VRSEHLAVLLTIVVAVAFSGPAVAPAPGLPRLDDSRCQAPAKTHRHTSPPRPGRHTSAARQGDRAAQPHQGIKPRQAIGCLSQYLVQPSTGRQHTITPHGRRPDTAAAEMPSVSEPPSGGVERPGRVVRFARLIQRPDCVLGRPSATVSNGTSVPHRAISMATAAHVEIGRCASATAHC
jgi:hypothetical protein